jgi:hypothetical protein
VKERGDKAVQRAIGLLSILVFFGFLATVDAQTASPAGTAFDGTYRFVSATKVTPMYTSSKGDMAPCPNRTPGPLTIAQGHARYTTETGYELSGTVGPQGQLAMRSVPVSTGGSRPLEIDATGGIDAHGNAHARQRASACSYDFVWQKS